MMYYKTNMALIKYGFNLENLKNMPIHEYHAYVRIYNEEIEKKNQEARRAASKSNSSSPPPMGRDMMEDE